MSSILNYQPYIRYFQPFAASLRWPRRLHLPVVSLLFASLAFGLLVACGGADTASPSDGAAADAAQEATQTPPLLWRYVNSGWVSPVEYFEASPYLDELHAFVITTQDELDAFNKSVVSKRILGNTTSLGRIDFLDSVLLAAYYVWRPVQGDPLSVVKLNVNGNSAVVDLELSDDPQGRLYPYLFAPMTMVSVNRSLFPAGQPVDFVFQFIPQGFEIASRHALFRYHRTPWGRFQPKSTGTGGIQRITYSWPLRSPDRRRRRA